MLWVKKFALAQNTLCLLHQSFSEEATLIHPHTIVLFELVIEKEWTRFVFWEAAIFLQVQLFPIVPLIQSLFLNKPLSYLLSIIVLDFVVAGQLLSSGYCRLEI